MGSRAGNSGGPLLDSRGRLIGVNTAATSHPQTTAGFGFAIPSDTVRRIVNQIIKCVTSLFHAD
jgi:S1-C subfamily serine protease